MNRLRALLADDEVMSRTRLRRLLGNQQDVEIVDESVDGEAALASIRRLQPDVVFLDIRMPGLSGFGVLDTLSPSQRPYVVFVTAHADHALRAFDIGAVDYLLKPYSIERLQASLTRVRARRDAVGMPVPEIAEGYARRLAVPLGPRLQLVDVAAIDCILACANYVELCVGERRHLLRETMASLERRLDPRHFVRVHRSRIVRIDAVRDVEPLGDGRCLLRLCNGMRVPGSNGYRTRVQSALGL
ncbi:LytR/AlgR family response regulator transcription factor [Marilutibacter alkalisoli]|uniref:Response regulator transcription factor n=1 Tax=Marilutibacter alkalisoli TaxID=2591633 RepID=A0A514BQ28_9GAMM|nr:LytTR family DNA-binding domain-containing protein [Lysobacter alkalisoli]QDH69498.1 response regulator transcription factor [Lysobacter alkalisoli]